MARGSVTIELVPISSAVTALAAMTHISSMAPVASVESATFVNSSLNDSAPMICMMSQSTQNATPSRASSPKVAPPKDNAPAKFGAKGSWRWEVEGSWMNDFDSDNQLQGAWYASWFLIENFSFDFGPEVAWFSQGGGNTWGAGPAFMFRWHFLARETWSIYADAGVGMMFTGSNVPSAGSSVNFTPRIGVGASFEVASNARILTGIRWAHISNANVDDNNDGRNSIQLYAGLSLPF